MPNRIIKESIRTSESISQLSWFEEVLFYRLLVSCDDYGRFDGRPAIIRGTCFPLASVTDKQIENALNKLSSVGMISTYKVEARAYLQIVAWERHQTVRAKKSKYPSEDERDLEASESTCMQMQADDCKCSRIRNRESESKKEKGTSVPEKKAGPARFQPPKLEEVEAYCRERGNSVDAQRWYDYYTANGWQVGKNHMKDWKAAVRTWERNGYAKAQRPADDGMTAAERSFYSKMGVI